MASNRERIRRACAEMKRLYGTPEPTVKAALKHLLTFFSNAWDRIEENNYNAIFEWTLENDKKKENKVFLCLLLSIMFLFQKLFGNRFFLARL